SSCCYFLFVSRSTARHVLHSFPSRPSSDLIAQVTHLPFVLAVAASLAGAFLLGLLVERLLLRPMIGERPIAVIMVTIGLAAVLRSAERTSELQSPYGRSRRLLLEKTVPSIS